MSVLGLIRSIPEGIWGVIIGSVLAFGATYVATRRQLRHDASQRERDRLMQLRREVFLEAAEGVAGSGEYFVKLANADLPVSDITAANPKPGWLNKLYTVASVEAIEAFSRASAYLGSAMFDLIRRRLPIDDVKNRLDAANQQIETMKELQEAIHAAAAAAAAEMATPEILERRQMIGQHWAQVWQESERLGALVSTLLDEKLKLQRQLLEQAMSYSRDYQKQLRKALVALRNDLEMPLDEMRFETIMDQIDAEMFPKFQQLLDALDAEISGSAA